jgi:release factor glutamine methyltransferase
MVETRQPVIPDFVPVCAPTVGALIRAAQSYLAVTNGAPRLEAEVLLAHVLACSRTHLYAHPERKLSSELRTRFQRLVSRRAADEPLPYLIGETQFYGMELHVDPRVLIPRPETETLVELAGAWLTAHRRAEKAPAVVDVGTGSGAIAISLAVDASWARIYAADLSSPALDVARDNARRHNVYERITFLLSDLLEALADPVDLIVSNPPYIAQEEWATLPAGVREREPRLALDGGVDGLQIIQRLLVDAARRLRTQGALMIEIGAAQGPEARKAARRAFPDAEIQIVQDLAGRDRVLSVQT